jgi:hypothetical protein
MLDDGPLPYFDGWVEGGPIENEMDLNKTCLKKVFFRLPDLTAAP